METEDFGKEAAGEGASSSPGDDEKSPSNKAVAFSTPPVEPTSNSNNSDDNDNDENNPPPPRGLSKSGTMARKSMYFDLRSGTRVEAAGNDARAEFNWRNSTKHIQMLEGDDVTAPAPPLTRLRRRLGLEGSSLAVHAEEGEDTEQAGRESQDEQQEDTTPKKHYRIESRSLQNDVPKSIRAASSISEYLRWTFHKSFVHVLLATVLQFLFLAILFAVLIYAVDTQQPQCITGGTRTRRDIIAFGDAYHLSWTTLSTVGYGVISPSLPKVDVGNTRCLGINVLMAVEAFIGVLFGGFAGAIIFGKIARVQSIASIRFSHPILIRYGLGVIGTGDNECEADGPEKDSIRDADVKWPCPILEFRIVNELSEQAGGEIMNASINVAVSSLEMIALADNSTPYLSSRKKKKNGGGIKSPIKATGGAIRHTGKALLGGTLATAHATGTLIQKLHHGLTQPIRHLSSHEVTKEREEGQPVNSAEIEKQVKAQIAQDLAQSVKQPEFVTVDEGNSKLAPRRIYLRLDIETDSHPFFKRVWNIRHVLNENSPVLSPLARKMIVENDGFWPAELSDHKSVRSHVHFEELIVSFSGTSNVSGSSVYAQKVYDYEHLNVGYAFAPILAMDEKGRMVVDHRLLNDVREQQGGGGEPIEEITETAFDSAEVIRRMFEMSA